MDGRETMRRDWNYPRFWNHPPEFFCQMHGENHTHDTSHCIVLRKEFAILYPDFMEYRRRRLEAAAPIGGRASGREMYYSHRQGPTTAAAAASWIGTWAVEWPSYWWSTLDGISTRRKEPRRR